MEIKFLRITEENKLENFGTLKDAQVVPRKGEVMNFFGNRLVVSNVEWFVLNQEIFVYIEDMKES